MRYVQTNFPEHSKPYEVIPAVRLSDKLQATLPVASSPFKPARPLLRARRAIILWVVERLEQLFRTTLYTKDTQALLYHLPPETRSLLSQLLKQGLLESWRYGQMSPGLPVQYSLYLTPQPRVGPSGAKYYAHGANGIGCGDSYSEAALSALGEFIERDSSSVSWWDNSSLYSAVYQPGGRMVDPHLLQLVSNDHYSTSSHFHNRQYDPARPLSWVRARDLANQQRVDIPAGLAYMLFCNEYPEEPRLCEVSSNGAATYSNYYEASCRATYELVERHSFITWWYQQLPATQLSLASLAEVVPYATQLAALAAHGIDVRVYDITSRYGLPTVALFLIDTSADSTAYLRVTASTNLSFAAAVQNVLRDGLRFAHRSSFAHALPMTASQAADVTWLQQQATGLTSRMAMWSNPAMAPHLAWLETAPEVQYTEAADRHTHMVDPGESKARHQALQQWAKAQSLRVYVADVTNTTARQAGLHVVRAVSPDLVPVFFNEDNAPLRQRNFTHTLGGNPAPLNPVPHPFI